MRILKTSAGRLASLLLGSATLAMAFGARPAAAQDITYNINQSVAAGSVVGQIVTNGATGVLTQSDIVSWNLQLNGGGLSTNITSAGGESGILLVGGDLTAQGKNLYFNYSGTDVGYVAFQASNPGFYSGQKYYCDNTTWYGCALGASVVPASYNDPSAQYDMSYKGNQIIATSQPTLPLAALYLSILDLSQARTAQMLVNQLESQLLLGLNEQVSCGSCGGGDINIGSAALSAHGRRALNSEWTILGGADIGQYAQKGADVSLNVGFAGAIQYDPAGFGPSRPYAEAGLNLSYQDTSYHRSYDNGTGTSVGGGSTHGYDLGAYAQLGWVDRISPRDEAAAYVEYSRTWQSELGYAEDVGVGNPYSADVPGGTDTMDTASFGAQYTHLFGRRVEADLNGGVQWAFNSHSGLRADIAGMTIPGGQPAFVYYQLGGRLGIRVIRRLTVDLFINSVLAPAAIGSSAHGGFGVRWAF